MCSNTLEHFWTNVLFEEESSIKYHANIQHWGGEIVKIIIMWEYQISFLVSRHFCPVLGRSHFFLSQQIPIEYRTVNNVSLWLIEFPFLIADKALDFLLTVRNGRSINIRLETMCAVRKNACILVHLVCLVWLKNNIAIETHERDARSDRFSVC